MSLAAVFYGMLALFALYMLLWMPSDDDWA